MSTEGKTTIAPDVLQSIAKLSCLKVPGVSRLHSLPGSVNQFLKKGGKEGVIIEVDGDVVNIDLFVIMEKDVNLRDVSKNVQSNVSRAISDMVGMQVGRVNIHVEDIDYPPSLEV